MTGSEADTARGPEPEAPGEEAPSVPRETLATFLTPVPTARSSAPPARIDRPAEEPASLFSELPVLRKDRSSFPPPGDAASGESPLPQVRSRPAIAFDPLKSIDERSLASVTVETEGVALEPNDDEDLELASIPPPLFESSTVRFGALAAGLVAGLLGVALVARRSGQEVNQPPPTATTAEVGAESAEAPAGAGQDERVLFEPYIARPVDATKARQLRLEARKLLEAGQAEEGVDVARRAIGADPNDPEGYVLLAAGLQDLGRWQESRDVFMKCVRESDRKANAECVYFATRSK